jgi:hypothetical protein
MKRRLLLLTAVGLGLVALGFGYCYFSGRLGFLKLDTHGRIAVNGVLVQGEILLGRTTAVVTTRQTGKLHSYQLFFTGDTDFTGNMGFVADCGAWVAPHFSVLPETRNYPPCWRVLHDLLDAGRWPLIDKGSYMQFTLQDRSIVAISHSWY